MLTKQDDWRLQLRELMAFLSTWFGISIDVQNQHSQESAHKGVPMVLSQFKRLLRGHALRSIFKQNVLLPIAKLSPQANPFVFYVENQGVYLWATDNSSDNPPVYGMHDGARGGWQLEEERLAGFLCQACMFEAVMQAPYGASRSLVRETEFASILEHWELTPFGRWRWPAHPSEFLQADGALAFFCPNGNEGFSFWCGAPSAERIAFMKPLVTDSWEYCSF